MEVFLSGFVGAILGGVLAVAGSFAANRHEFIRIGRVAIAEDLLPPLTSAIRAEKWSEARTAMGRLTSKAWTVAEKDHLLIDDARRLLNELTNWDEETRTHTDPSPPLSTEETQLKNQLLDKLSELRRHIHQKLVGRTVIDVEWARSSRRSTDIR